MSYQILLFAAAKERVGAGSIELITRTGLTVGELKQALVAAHPCLQSLLPSSLIAVNSEYASEDLMIPAGAEVAVIPPVSGGCEKPAKA